MAHRLTRIVTRTGDAGETGLADGSRLPKHAPRVTALGEVDELNCLLGLLLCEVLPEAVRGALAPVQHELFELGATLSLPGWEGGPGERHVQRLDDALSALNALLPPLREFVLPGGTRAAAVAHVARAVCRRAERALCALHAREPVPPQTLQYLNRLSDLLFVAARTLNAGGCEPQWRREDGGGSAQD